MRISKAQRNVLLKLSQPYEYGKHHPRDAYNSRTLEVLERKGLVKFYDCPMYLHGAVKITEEGKRVLEEEDAEMKATTGDKIKVTKRVCYGTVYGLVQVEEGTILTVANRTASDDGVETVEKVTLKNELGQVAAPIHVWDKDYIIVR